MSELEFSHQNQKISSPWEYLSFDIKTSRISLLHKEESRDHNMPNADLNVGKK